MDRTGAVIRITPTYQDHRPCSVFRSATADGVRWPRAFTRYLAEPLIQRPAGSPGKRGRCELSFVATSGKTLLQHAFVTHPFHLTRPWYLDPALPGMAVTYLQTPAGGLIQGDRTHLRFTLGPQAQIHCTTQAAEKIHTMAANCALQQVSFVLDADAYAEYCPEPVILFPGARFGQELCVELGRSASCFLAEIFVSPRAAEGSPGPSFEALTTSLRVTDVNGTLLVRDRSLILPRQRSLAGPGILGPYHVWGQALLIGPQVSPTWAQKVHDRISAESGVVCGATVLPRGRGVGVKVVGAEVRAVRRVVHAAWQTLRSCHLGVPAPQFPK